MEDKELKVLKSRVIEASKNCVQARDVLKDMFPEAFEEEEEGWENITNHIQWKMKPSGWTNNYVLIGYYDHDNCCYYDSSSEKLEMFSNFKLIKPSPNSTAFRILKKK